MRSANTNVKIFGVCVCHYVWGGISRVWYVFADVNTYMYIDKLIDIRDIYAYT